MTIKKKIYDNPGENEAFMQGFVSGRKADGEDWVRVRLEIDDERAQKEQAWAEMLLISGAAQKKIKRLEEENEALRSRLLAYQVALRSLVQEDLQL